MSRRKKKQEMICTEEMFDETRGICEDYASAMKRMKQNKECLKLQISKRNSADSDFEREMYESDVERLKDEIRKDDENTSYFRWALSHLSEREQTVMTQLYVDGYTWDSVVSESEEKMSVGAIDKARKRGIKKMAILIADMKKRMVKSAKSSESSKTAESIQSAESSKLVESSKSAESAKPTESAKSSE